MLHRMFEKIFEKLGFKKSLPDPVETTPAGLYRVVDKDRVTTHFLEDAVPPQSKEEGEEPAAFPRYAWMRGGFVCPNPNDFYIVKFQNEEEFIVVAYADSFRRVFQCSVPQEIPPAKWPSLELERSEAGGLARVYGLDGSTRVAASFFVNDGLFTVDGSWFDFSQHCMNVSSEEALSRAFLALVHRPETLGLKPPLRGIGLVEDQLNNFQVLESMNRIVHAIRTAEEDLAQKPPALLCCFAQWLQEAGLASALANERTESVAQVHMAHSSMSPQMCYLTVDDGCDIPERTIWKLEGALNRYYLLREQLGTRAASVSMEECKQRADHLFASVIEQAADAELPRDMAEPIFARDWNIRLGIAQGMEALKLPLRLGAEFRYDSDEGLVSFEMVAPDIDMIPGRDAEVMQGYAMRVGVLLAALAFSQSNQVKQVSIDGSYFYDEKSQLDLDTSVAGSTEMADRVFKVTFNRDQFADRAHYVTDVEANPRAFYEEAGAVIGSGEGEQLDDFDALLDEEVFEREIQDAVEAVDVLVAGKDSALKTDVQDRQLGLVSSMALGCRSTRNLRINYNAAQKYYAQEVADQLKDAENLQEGVKVLRAMQEQTNDPKVLASCNRVMEQLALGEADMRDSARVVSLFVGDDPYLDALTRSRAISMNPKGSADEAIAILREVVDPAEAMGVFSDDERMVYRIFDSSSSRVIYNLSREGMLRTSGVEVRDDSGKGVELAPDSYLFCNLELVRLLENTFDRVDDALMYGKNALRLAPTMTVGYRTLARVYMLMGDPNSSRDLLYQALRFAVHPTELGYLYYQLGYTEWKAGRLRVAIACYLKAIMEAPALHAQISNELRALLGEDGARMMDLSQVLPALRAANVPLAPNEEVLARLKDAAEAATNEGLFPAARNMLSLYLHHKPNDVLSHVLRSLG